ncbi:hypothetical protein GMRT_15583 [Giardia muris]|uniref:Importin N-terminal domain-containing protein n=1 Tax=Giardia muris TaxID=5742 RepID=A0A4Z1SSE9_GIAMU|nr:hypothetical protein GMRT_15583 [Giardia muris]|eukprot:TNJ28826.1 hypothetical protein GMRT_15583 [Giardia muris]
MDSDSLCHLLVTATSPDAEQRAAATATINKYVAESNHGYFRGLLSVLCGKYDSSVRQQAAIQTKNFFRSADIGIHQARLGVWQGLRYRDRQQLLDSIIAQLESPGVQQFVPNILSSILEAEAMLPKNTTDILLTGLASVARASPQMMEAALKVFKYFYEDTLPATAKSLVDPGNVILGLVGEALFGNNGVALSSLGLEILVYRAKLDLVDVQALVPLFENMLCAEVSLTVFFALTVPRLLAEIILRAPATLDLSTPGHGSLLLELVTHVTTVCKHAYTMNLEGAFLKLPSGGDVDTQLAMLSVLNMWDVLACSGLLNDAHFTPDMIDALVRDVLLPIIRGRQYPDLETHCLEVGNIREAAALTLSHVVRSSRERFEHLFSYVCDLCREDILAPKCVDPTNLTESMRDIGILMILRAFLCHIIGDVSEQCALRENIIWLLNTLFERVSCVALQNSKDQAPKFCHALSSVAADTTVRMAEHAGSFLRPLISRYMDDCVRPLIFNAIPSGQMAVYGLNVFSHLEQYPDVCEFLSAPLPSLIQLLATHIGNYIMAGNDNNALELARGAQIAIDHMMTCLTTAGAAEKIVECLRYYLDVLNTVGPQVLAVELTPANRAFLEYVVNTLISCFVSFQFLIPQLSTQDPVFTTAVDTLLQFLAHIYQRTDADSLVSIVCDFLSQAAYFAEAVPEIDACFRMWLSADPSRSLLAICGHCLEVNVDSFMIHHSIIGLLQAVLRFLDVERIGQIYALVSEKLKRGCTVQTKSAIVLLLGEAITQRKLMTYVTGRHGQGAGDGAFCVPQSDILSILSQMSNICASSVLTDQSARMYVSTDIAQLSKSVVKTMESFLYFCISDSLPCDSFVTAIDGTIMTISKCYKYKDEQNQIDLAEFYTPAFKAVLLSMIIVAKDRVAVLGNYICRSQVYSFLKELHEYVQAQEGEPFQRIASSFFSASHQLSNGYSERD